MTTNSNKNPTAVEDSANKNEDCLTCRVISGVGCIAMGLYIYSQSAKQKAGVANNGMKVLATIPIGLGIARLLNLNVLNTNKNR